MRAFALDDFGAPTTGSMRDLPVPEPAAGEVRVRIEAAGVNPSDVAMSVGAYKDIFPTTFPLVPGRDLAGTIDALGPGVDGFAEGDVVFGNTSRRVAGEGTFAEFALASAGGLARRPAILDAAFGAAIPLVGSAALQLLELTSPAPDDVVVVVGATGGIGSAVLPLLRAAGARAIAVTRTTNGDYARELGAAEVIDYEATDVAAAVRDGHGDGIAAVIDLVGSRALNEQLTGLLRPGGHLASMRGGADPDALRARGLTGANLMAMVTRERLERLAQRITDGTLPKPEIRTFALEQAGEALATIAGGHTRGKLVLTV